MSKYTEPFTDGEREELARVNAIRQRIKAQRRNRQAVLDENERRYAEQRKAREEAEAAERRKVKAEFDQRLRDTLLALTLKMGENRVHIVPGNSLGYGGWKHPEVQDIRGNRILVFNAHDSEGKVPSTQVYWVYGKGFEWD
jgi:hypothetical protein